MKRPIISIIVPCYNSAANLRNFLQSCVESEFKDFEVIINDDKRTDDNTPEVVAKYDDKLNLIYKRENMSMAQGRKVGASFARGSILMHLDSDMRLTPELVGDCVAKLQSGEVDALVITEESYGTTFWAKCKWLEKKCYEGVEQIESLRCLRRDLYEEVGGHDQRMVFSEDKDLDIRVRSTGARVGRSQKNLMHNEGALKLKRSLTKKQGYAVTANVFAKVHPSAYRWQANIFNRYMLYFKRYKLFFAHPVIYLGMLYMKTCEYGAAAAGLLATKLRSG